MTRPEDAPLLAALEYQYRELGVLLHRVERMRLELVPPPPSSWKGAARRAFGEAVNGLHASIDACERAVRTAHARTGTALVQVQFRV